MKIEDIESDDKIILVTIGVVVNSIPRANLFYRVRVPASIIKDSTEHVLEVGWFDPDKLSDLYLSPSTGDLGPLLEVIKTEMQK